MTVISQRAAVYCAVKSVINFNDGDVVELTKEQKQTVYEAVSLLLHQGQAEFSEKAKAKYSTLEDIRKKYTPGLVSNWLRKDTRLNGGVKYEAKNPGSRAGQGDKKLKSMKGLLTQFKAANAPADKLEILEKAIEARTQEVLAEKAKAMEVDLSILSPELMEMLGLKTEES